MAQLGVLITWREVTGTEPTQDLLHQRLAPFRLEAVLVGFSRLAATLKTWQNAPSFDVDRRLAHQFLPRYRGALSQIYDRGGNRVVFARISILFVLKQACSVCADQGRDVQAPDDIEQLLSCCLIGNDLVLARLPGAGDTAIERATSLLPFTNYVPNNTYPTDLARNLLLIEEIGPQLAARADYIDLGDAFRTATGLTARQFCELTLATSVKFITHVDAQLQAPNTAFLLTRAFYEQSAIPARDVTAFLNQLSTAPRALRDEARRPATLGSDFLLFQRRPLIEIADQAYVCPDPGFLLDKAGPSLYWTLHEATSPGRRHALLTYWCGLIEKYAHWLFGQTYQGRGQVLLSPKFGNGDEVCDVLLQEGSTLLFFEVKASILTVQAKYGFAPDNLRQELHLKTITGDEGERKGVAQLSANLRRYLEGQEIPDIDLASVKTIFPVLVFYDHAFTSPYLNAAYNEHFNSGDLRRAYRKRITPLFSITIDDLENALPYTSTHDLCDIFESYYRANKGMHGTLSHGRVPLLQGAQPGKDEVRGRFTEFGRGLVERFFPGASLAVS
jgi:hypothetical protein